MASLTGRLAVYYYRVPLKPELVLVLHDDAAPTVESRAGGPGQPSVRPGAADGHRVVTVLPVSESEHTPSLSRVTQ